MLKSSLRINNVMIWITIIYCGINTVTGQTTNRTANSTNATKPTTFTYPTTRLYNPNYGFKQYWPGGDWKLLGKTLLTPTTRSTTTNTLNITQTTIKTTTKKATTPWYSCGSECPKHYRNISEVCVIRTDAKDARQNEYQNMSFCEYLNKSNPRCVHDGWDGIAYAFVHVGLCLRAVFDKRDERHTPSVVGGTHKRDYTPDAFDFNPEIRYKKFINKFYNQSEWTKFYPGSPYPRPFESWR